MRILVTRPLEDAKRQADQLRALGHKPIIFPLLEVIFHQLAPLALDGVQGIIVTSRNGLRALQFNDAIENARKLPLFCVGEGTAALATEFGFERVISGDGRASDLLPIILSSARPENGALLYVTGHHIAFDLEAPLKQAGFLVPHVVCYEANELHPVRAANLADMVRRGEVKGIILMSPRTAAIFARIIKRFDIEREARAITCYCYSEAIAKSLEDINGLTIAISSHPREEDLMRRIGAASLHDALAELEHVLGKR